MKKILSILLILSLSLLTLVSCGDRKYDEAEVKAAAKTLIADSAVLNDIFWGKGIPHTDDKNTSDGVYFEAYYYYHKNLGFETVDELMTMAAKTFSADQCSVINSTILSSVSVGEEVMSLSRYYQKVNLKDGKTPEAIMVNSTWENLLIGEAAYDLDSIEVIGSEKDTVYVTVKVTVTLEDYEPQTRTLRVALVEEDAGWRIDSPTYISYDKTNLNK